MNQYESVKETLHINKVEGTTIFKCSTSTVGENDTLKPHYYQQDSSTTTNQDIMEHVVHSHLFTVHYCVLCYYVRYCSLIILLLLNYIFYNDIF